MTGILVQGSNGEAQHLSHAERARAIVLTRRVLDENGFKHTLVIAGTGAQTVRETRQLNAEAAEAGATYALVLTPSTWYAKMTKDIILKFHRDVRAPSRVADRRAHPSVRSRMRRRSRAWSTTSPP
jgi:4-hydroxy-2-oxoglutarate aldolase